MEETRENGKKLGTKTKWAILAGGALAVIVLVIVLVCTLGKKEEAYRNIRVSEVTGTVVVNREGKEGLAAYANMNLQSGDEIVTEAGARASLRLDDEKYVILDENSKLTLHAAGTAEDSKTTLTLEYGAVFSDIKDKLSESSGYEVITPASTMSVRGTQFEVVFRNGQAKVLTYEGAVYVAPEGAAEGRTVEAGCWTAVVQTEDGTCGFDGEIKTITAEDVGSFVSSYLEDAGITFEEDTKQPEPTKEPEAELTKVPEVTEESAVTEAPVLTDVPETEPTEAPEPTPSPVPTKAPEVKPMKEPVATPEPKPTKEPVTPPDPAKAPVTPPDPAKDPLVKSGDHAVYYYIPLPPKNILPSDKAYTVTYSKGELTLRTAESTDTYKANVNPTVTNPATLETDAGPLIMAVTEKQFQDTLAKRLAEYGEGTTANCFGWYDAGRNMWLDWTRYLRDASLEDGVLKLYPAYTVHAPAYNISCVPVLVTVEETGEVFCLSLPEGSALKLDGGSVWKENGTETESVNVQYSTISQFTLSVGK